MPKILGVFKENAEQILNTYSLPELRKEVDKVQLKGYANLNKKDLVAFMMKTPHLFTHLKGKKGPEKGMEGPTMGILMSYSVTELRKEVSKTLLKKYHTMSKAEVIALILLHSHRFTHLTGKRDDDVRSDPVVVEDKLEIEEMPDSRFHPDGYNLIVTDAVQKLRDERSLKYIQNRLPLYRDIPFFKEGATRDPDTGVIFTKETWYNWRQRHGFIEDRDTDDSVLKARIFQYNGEWYWRDLYDNTVYQTIDGHRPTGADKDDVYGLEVGQFGDPVGEMVPRGYGADFVFNERFKPIERKKLQVEEEERIRGDYSKSHMNMLIDNSDWATFAEETFSTGRTESLPFAWELWKLQNKMEGTPLMWGMISADERTIGEYLQNDIQGPEM